MNDRLNDRRATLARAHRRDRGWGRARSRGRGLAVPVAALQVLIGLGAAHGHGPGCAWASCGDTRLTGWGWVLVAAGPVALLFARRAPRPALGVVLLAAVVYQALGLPAGPVFPSLAVSVVWAVGAGERRAAWAALAAAWASLLWLPAALGTGDLPGIATVARATLWAIGLTVVAELMRTRRERFVAQRRTREAEGERRAEEERLRIARELHDVLAHNISLINVQSGVALHLLEQRPDQAREALSIINEASADALREMRSVLGVLRRVDEHAPRAPTAGLERLPELVSSAAAAGVRVDTDTAGAARPLGTAVDLAAYRIVQESLTNVARHAGGGRATVHLRYGPEAIAIEVDDDGTETGASPAASGDGSGNGIAGMRERAAALGGELHAGPRDDGPGFRVRAWLPYGSRT